MPIDGILPVIPTPFTAGRFDERSFQRLLDHMLPFVDGYTLLGSTGEAPSLSISERIEIATAALNMTPRDKRVVVGVSSTCASDSVALAVHAQESGAAGVLCSSPYYFPNSPGGIFEYLAEIDAVLSVDMVLYDNSVSTKTVLTASDVVTWSRELKHLTAVKLTDHDLRKIPLWQEAGLNVLAGDDVILYRFIAAGVDGAMVIAPAVFPAAFAEVWKRACGGDSAGAMTVFALEVLPFLHVFGIGDEIATTKALFEELGLFVSGETRPPLERPSNDRQRLLIDAYGIATAQTAARASSAAPLAGSASS